MRRNRGFMYAPNTAAAATMFRYGSTGTPVGRGRRVTVQPWEQGLLFRDGQLVERLGPGSKRIWGARHQFRTVDVRSDIMTLPTQEVPTSDGISVKITAVARTKVIDAGTFVSGSQHPGEEMYLAIQVALREIIGATALDHLLQSRVDLPGQILSAMRPTTDLGMEVESLEIKDIILPREIKHAQAEVLVATAQAKAALERARGETAALRSLTNAARLTEDHPTLFQLRLLQELGSSSGHTVVIGSEPAIRSFKQD